MGKTRKATDWLGREKEEHFDDSGNKAGETRFTTDWLGNRVQQHFDSKNNKTGETRAGSDWLGRDRAEHFDTEKHRVGTSRNETDWLGRPVQRHYDDSRHKVGETRPREDWLGRPFKENKGEYFKAGRVAGPTSSGGSEGYTSSTGTSPRATGRAAALAIAVLGILALMLFGRRDWQSLLTWQTPDETLTETHANAVVATVPLLDRARRAIPQNLQQIYRALNEGNPSATQELVSGRLKANFERLDFICKPFTYRAHYIEAIIERAGNRFEVRTHVLFEPMDEHAYALTFAFTGSGFVLEDVADPNDDWFGSEKEVAVELARNFVFAAEAHRGDALASTLSSGLATDVYATDDCWQQFFYDAQYDSHEPRVMGTELTSYKGLKVEVDIDLSPAIGFGYRDLGRAHFLVENVGGAYKIVSADPRGDYRNFYHTADQCKDPTVLQKREDPDLEIRTLKRFGIAS